MFLVEKLQGEGSWCRISPCTARTLPWGCAGAAWPHPADCLLPVAGKEGAGDAVPVVQVSIKYRLLSNFLQRKCSNATASMHSVLGRVSTDPAVLRAAGPKLSPCFCPVRHPVLPCRSSACCLHLPPCAAGPGWGFPCAGGGVVKSVSTFYKFPSAVFPHVLGRALCLGNRHASPHVVAEAASQKDDVDDSSGWWG